MDDSDIFSGLVPSKEEFTGIIPDECYFNDYDEDTFKALMEEQLALIRLLKKHDQPKYLANRILVIFDDLVGSSLFGGARQSYFKGINTRHRHYSTSFIMVSQGYKEVNLQTEHRYPRQSELIGRGLLLLKLVMKEKFKLFLKSIPWV